MANPSSSYPILCASFNQDFSLFAIATRDGFKIFDSDTGRLCYERAIGAFTIVEMLFSSSLLAIVGGGQQPSLSPRRLCLFNTTTGTALRELNFLTSILAVRMNRKRLVVLLQDKTYVYDINSLTILDTIDTVPNFKGLCAFSPSLDCCFLALPASTARGSMLLYNVMELHSHCEIDAHRAPLAAIVFSSKAMYIATASEQGTIIRVHSVSEATKSYSFRRGTYPSTIFSLSFGPSVEIPDILMATSSSGSVHAFSLRFGISQRSRRSNSILGSIIPESFTDALVTAHHDVLHNAAPAGVKSILKRLKALGKNKIQFVEVVEELVASTIKIYAVIRKVDKVADPSVSETLNFRATISMLTYNGYFQEYILSMNSRDEFSWRLAREFNLLSDDAICS